MMVINCMNYLNKIWNDPFQWWYSEDVQEKLNKFRTLYTKMPDKNFNINFKI